MRLGWIISAIAHVGFILALLTGCPAMQSKTPAESTISVPIDIVATAPESNVRALAIPTPDQSAPAAADVSTPEPEPTPTPTPAPPSPTPPRHTQTNQFDPARIADLLNRDRRDAPEHHTGQDASRNQTGAGRGTQDVASLQDRAASLLKAEMLRCWRAPIDLPNPDRLVVTVHIELDRNGNLRGQPSVISPPGGNSFDPAMRTAVASALRAVRACDPYTRLATDPIVGSHYEIWRAQDYVFRPEQN